MMRFSDYPFLRYLPFFVLGVMVSSVFAFAWYLCFLILGGIWGVYTFFIFSGKSKSGLVLPALAYCSLFVLGLGISRFHESQKNQNTVPDLSVGYFGKVLRHDLQKPNSKENLIEIIASQDSLGWKKSSGKVIAYHKSDLNPGQMVLVKKSPDQIDPPIFPEEFDYREFLNRQGIQYRQFIGNEMVILDSPKSSPELWLINFRKSLSRILDQNIPSQESRQIASALLLGEKEGLDRDLRNSYSETGTMHILAVSGLHVGIVYAILLFPLGRFSVNTKLKKSYLLGVILVIWIYALLTGFSPSVIRAATMFSLFTFGQMRKRKPSVWNILAFSAMVMITLNPDVIYEVGFQLSYLAVAGIVGLQPLILRWWQPSHRLLEYFWQLASVSLAAQLATFPVTVFYFHIFPTYFLFANLIIIPMAFVSMVLGLVLFSFSWVEIFGKYLGLILDYWIYLQNSINSFFQNLPGGVMERLTISGLGMLSAWVILIIWGNWEWGNRKQMLYWVLVIIFIWRLDVLIHEFSSPSTEIQQFSRDGKNLIQIKIGDHFLAWNQDFPPDQISYSLEPFRIKNGIPLVQEPLKGVLFKDRIYFPVLGFNFSLVQKEISIEQELGFEFRKFGK